MIKRYFKPLDWEFLLSRATTDRIRLPTKSYFFVHNGKQVFNPFCDYAARVYADGILDIRGVWLNQSGCVYTPVCIHCPAAIDKPHLCLGGIMAEYNYARQRTLPDTYNQRFIDAIKSLKTIKLKEGIKCINITSF